MPNAEAAIKSMPLPVPPKRAQLCLAQQSHVLRPVVQQAAVRLLLALRQLVQQTHARRQHAALKNAEQNLAVQSLVRRLIAHQKHARLKPDCGYRDLALMVVGGSSRRRPPEFER